MEAFIFVPSSSLQQSKQDSTAIENKKLPYLHSFHFHFMNHLSWHQSLKGNRFHRRTESNHGTDVLWLLERELYHIFLRKV